MAKKNKQEEKCVAILLLSNKDWNKTGTRYLSWIDENWYGTTSAPAFVFPESQLSTIKEQLHSHFLYYATIMYKDGSKVEWSSFAERKKTQPKVIFKPFKGISLVFKKKIG